MWQEAKANDRRIKELMNDHKKRAERRRAYYESRLGDPQQLIRVIGVSSKIYPDAEQFYYHENPDNLMPWQGNPDIKIDRFDGRSLLDFVPDTRNQRGYQDVVSKEDREMNDELNFERYHDLIEAERLNVTESERLAEVEEEWTKLLDRHQAKLALLKNQEKGSGNNNAKSRGFGFDYGTGKANEEDLEENDEEESKLLKEVDILQYVDDLTDKDKQALNEMSRKYGIKSYARLLRVAKKDRDEELRSLKRRQEEGKPKEGTRNSRRRSNERRRRRRRRRGRDYDLDDESRYRRRYSPTYEPYGQGSDGSGSSMSEDDEEEDGSPKNDFVIEFGSSEPDENMAKNQREDEDDKKQKLATPVAPIEKKLTPMEKLKLKMRAGLEKQIVSDEKDRRQKEKAKEIENLQELARSQGLPINTYLRPDPPQREYSTHATTTADGNARYRSPSSDGSASPTRPLKKHARSPSSRSDYNRKSSRSRSRDRKSSSKRRRSRSNDRRSPISSSSSKKRSLSRDKHRSSSSRDHRRPRSRSRSPHSSSRRSRYRSPSEDRGHHSRKYSRRYSRSRSRSRSPISGSGRRR